jgi:hypothetical protein
MLKQWEGERLRLREQRQPCALQLLRGALQIQFRGKRAARHRLHQREVFIAPATPRQIL